MTFRRAIVSSLNVPAAHVLMDDVTPAIAAQYLYELGATENKINVDGAGLALGTSGLTPIQMAAAYATIANEGVYQEPLSFTKVLDAEGNVILDADEVRDTHRVFQQSTAWLLVDMMTDAVKTGTGTKAKIDGHHRRGKDRHELRLCQRLFCGHDAVLCLHALGRTRLPRQQAQEGLFRRKRSRPALAGLYGEDSRRA